MLEFVVNPDRCSRCGDCVSACPASIIHMADTGMPAIAAKDEVKCLRCQHCLAVCPEAAVSIFGLDPDHSLPLANGNLPSREQMELLIRGRRSCRSYLDQNVDRSLLKDLLATLAHAPTGVNRQELTCRVVDDRTTLRGLRGRLYGAALNAAADGSLPADSAVVSFAQTHQDSGHDIVFRDAPHALILSAPPDAPCPQEDVTLALAYFELLAQSAGLGTVWCGLLKRCLEALPHLKPLFGLPADHVYYPMLFGLPAVRYPRTVQRDADARVEWIRLG